MDPRRRFLVDFARIIILPQIIANAVLHLSSLTPHIALRISLSLLSIPCMGMLRSLYTAHRDRSFARESNRRLTNALTDAAPDALGAVPVPRVKGKWPGNLDIVLQFIKSLTNDYQLQFAQDMFEKHGCKTLNMRMLWEDQVRTPHPRVSRGRILASQQIWTIDESHVKYMLAGPGFEFFTKGYYVYERLCVRVYHFEHSLRVFPLIQNISQRILPWKWYIQQVRAYGVGLAVKLTQPWRRDRAEWQAVRVPITSPWSHKFEVKPRLYQQRAMARPWFAKDRISDLNIFDWHTSTTLTLMSSFAEEGVAFDAQDLLARFTLDSASEFLFGKCLNSLAGKLPVAGSAKMGPKGSSTEDEFGTFAWAFEVSRVPSSSPYLLSSK